MKKLLAVLSLFVSASVFAQTQGSPTSEVIAEGNGFVVSISTYKPGDVSPIAKRPIRVIQALTDGSLQRTFEDGTKDNSVYKKGETKIIGDEKPYEIKNITDSVVKLYVVRNK